LVEVEDGDVSEEADGYHYVGRLRWPNVEVVQLRYFRGYPSYFEILRGNLDICRYKK
jgi:hypothetical protein